MLPRRTFLASLSAAAVVGFDPSRRAWAHAPVPELACAPALEGELVSDPAALASVSSDVGGIATGTPIAILRPASVRDVSVMLRFCAQHGIAVAARGQGHTTFGQSLASGGLVVETRTLSTLFELGADFADVGAGLLWTELLAAATAVGLTPPVFTGYTGLSIGGTLSVGGVPASFQRGIQIEHVRSLEVVTGEGEVVCCSAQQHRDLFEAVLAGLGQCGIITRAVVALEPAPLAARQYLLEYTDNAQFFADLRALVERRELDDLYTLWLPSPSGGWVYQLNAVKFHDPEAPPDDAVLLRGLSYDPATFAALDQSYVDYILRVDRVIDQFRAAGLWDGVLHPWFDVFLPDAAVEQYVGEVIPALSLDDVGPAGFVLLFPLQRSAITRPLFRIPDEDAEWFWLFDILTSSAAPGPDPEFAARMLTRNRSLYDKARALGATRYPIGTLEFSAEDWRQHYAEAWRGFCRAKRRYDPACILAPGPGIFGA